MRVCVLGSSGPVFNYLTGDADIASIPSERACCSHHVYLSLGKIQHTEPEPEDCFHLAQTCRPRQTACLTWRGPVVKLQQFESKAPHTDSHQSYWGCFTGFSYLKFWRQTIPHTSWSVARAPPSTKLRHWWLLGPPAALLQQYILPGYPGTFQISKCLWCWGCQVLWSLP